MRPFISNDNLRKSFEKESNKDEFVVTTKLALPIFYKAKASKKINITISYCLAILSYCWLGMRSKMIEKNIN